MKDSAHDQFSPLTPLTPIPPGAQGTPGSAQALESDTLKIGSLSALGGLQGLLDSPPSVQLSAAAGVDGLPQSCGDPARKYQVDSVIGKGGMGTVFKVFDGDLRRWVAMKVVRKDVARQKEHLSRFIEEAQVCGQLEHPNIPPVHEIGADPEGQIYFTMKLVKGRTLQEISRDLSLGRPEVRREFTPIRLAQTLQQAAMGIHYANVRGVIHRDLKPENIMVGDYGEVLVMDWGLAKVRGEESDARLFGEDSVVTTRTESGFQTMAGAVQGTPSYMSPEQARGEQDSIDARTDVFGLGAVLYTLLCYQPPYRGRTVDEILRAARTGSPPPPSRVAPRRTEVPPGLEAICMKAISAEREQRHADAREFQADLQSYIEGIGDRERRRAQAQGLAAEGKKQISAYSDLEKKRDEWKRRAEGARSGIAPYDPIERKGPLWEIEDSIAKIEEEAARLFARARATLDAAIQTDPGCQEARKALADLYWNRFQEAEARRDPLDAALHRGLVEAYDTGQYAALLKGDGSLTLRTDPPDAEALLYRYVEENRVLVPREARVLGRTPFGPVPLPMGSYLVVLRLPGRVEARYPVFIGRSEDHVGAVKLHTEGEIGPGLVYVPAGEFIRGGDSQSFGGAERSRVYVDGFFIGRFPVTMGEYCQFLDDLAARGEPVAEHLSRLAEEVYIQLGPDGRHHPSEAVVVEENRKRYPPGHEVNCPALGVNWHSAMAYARWRSVKDGREYGLAPEEAWEKAARGVDGRFHPWGDRFDWTFMKGGLSRPGRAQPEPVGAFPTDESPYGVRDMMGTIREWTGSWFDERAGTRAVRGGSWNLVGANHFRCANRLGYMAVGRTSTMGFRLYTAQPGRGR